MDATGERQKSDPAEGRERIAALSRQERLRSRSNLRQRPAFVKLNAALRCPAERSRSTRTSSAAGTAHRLSSGPDVLGRKVCVERALPPADVRRNRGGIEG